MLTFAVWLACSSPSPEPLAVEPALAPPAAAPAVRVHLTIDDVPWQLERGQEQTLSVRDVVRHNERILRHLEQADVRASAFVTCDRLRPGDGLVGAWVAAGQAVGNHSMTHPRAAKVGSEAFLADVEACQQELTQRLGGAAPRFVRYPYLSYGADSTEQVAIELGLKRLGLVNAPVALPTAEWALVPAYRQALIDGDEARQRAIADAWLEHLLGAVDAGERLAQAALGRSVPHTMLLHANELTADHLGELVARLREAGVELVDLEEALSDEVYKRPVRQRVTGALPWVARVSEGELPEASWFDEEEGRLRAAWLPEGPWPVGVSPVARDLDELARWLRQGGFSGDVRPGRWPSVGKGAPPPPDPGGDLQIAKLVDATKNTAGFHHAYEMRCHADREALEALAAWASSSEGLARPSAVVPLQTGGCVASVLTPEHDFLLDHAHQLATGRPR